MKSYYLEGNPLRKWLVLTAVCLAVFTITVNTTAVMNALLAMSNELHLTPIDCNGLSMLTCSPALRLSLWADNWAIFLGVEICFLSVQVFLLSPR